MNKQLQEFYLVASEQFKIVQDQGLPAPYQTRAFAEKFAELIVRECAGVIVEEMKITPQVHDYWGPYWDGLDSAQKMITKHFGVE